MRGRAHTTYSWAALEKLERPMSNKIETPIPLQELMNALAKYVVQVTKQSIHHLSPANGVCTSNDRISACVSTQNTVTSPFCVVMSPSLPINV